MPGIGGRPDLSVQLLVGSSVFTLDVSSLDGPDHLGWDMSTDWSDVACSVHEAHWQTGATRVQGALTRYETGTCVLTLYDVDRRYDPSVGGSGVIRPGTPLRLLASLPGWTETMWTGAVDAVTVDYQTKGPNVVRVEASDIGRRLVLYDQNAEPTPVGLNDDIVARVKRALRQAGIDDTLAAGSDSAGTVPFQATDLARTGWETVTDAVDSELGRAWITRDNLMAVKARLSGYDGPLRGTVSNVHADGDPTHLCVTGGTMTLGAELLTNRAIAAPAGGTVVQVDNTASQAKYAAIHTYDRRDLILKDQTAALAWAQFLVNTQAEAELRIDQLAPTPQSNPAVWQNVCATGINDRWQVTLTPRSGPAFDRTAAILGLEHTVTRQDWDITWHTLFQGVTQQGGWFWIDRSLLDGPDLLMP